jgi:hypothetical protein
MTRVNAPLKRSLSLNNEPTNLRLGLLAYALPFEGTHIVVFYDREERSEELAWLRVYVRHVIAHEVTHILQGAIWHSETGIMKAHGVARTSREWTGSRFSSPMKT